MDEYLADPVARFRSRFPEIRVGLNWQRFSHERWPISVDRITDRATALELFTFVRTSFGRVNRRGLFHGISRNMRVREVLAKLDRLQPHHRDSIEYFQERFSANDGPVILELPFYDLGRKGQFILDGNHRVCGLMAAHVPFELRVYAVRGPVARYALPDSVFCR